MAAREKYYLDGILLDYTEVTDSFSAAVARYGVPYKNGPQLKYMGIEDSTVKIHCYFVNDRYAEHFDFIKKIFSISENEDSHELRHPVFGILTGSVENLTVARNDRRLTAEIDFTFVVEGDPTGAAAPEFIASVVASCESSYNAAQSAQMDKFAGDADDAIGSEAGEIMDVDIDENASLLSQFLTASTTARTWLAEIDQAIEICESISENITLDASDYLETIDYGTKLPGRFVSAVANALARIAAGSYSEDSSAKAYLDNLNSAYSGFIALFSSGDFNAKDQVEQAAASKHALETAYAYDRDNTESLLLQTFEETNQFDILGRRTVTSTAPIIMTINELEETLYASRALCQRAIDIDRSNAAEYKKMAVYLLRHVQAVRLKREKIITVMIDTEMPLFVICIRNDLPIRYAARILSINPQIENPSFVSGEVKIYAR